MNFRKILSLAVSVCLFALIASGCTSAPASGGGGGGNPIASLVTIVAIISIFYLMMLRPEAKRKKKAMDMRDATEVGDNITTIGGMVGKVVHVTEDKITFETGEDRVRIETMKWAISENRGKGSNKDKGDSEEVLKS